MVEQSRLAQQLGTGTSTRQNRDALMHQLEPLRFGLILPGSTVAGIDEEIRDADDIGLRAIDEIMMRRDGDVIGRHKAIPRPHRLPLAIRSGGHNVAGYAVCEAGMMTDMTLMNGVRLSPALDRAFGDRSAPFMLSLDAIWSDAKDDAANIAWARNAWDHLQRHSTGRLYLNFPGLGEDQSLVKNALGEATFARLQQVKRKYDPHNLFRLNQNIQPD